MPFTSNTYILPTMPAKPLTPQQLEDTSRLQAIFKAWQSARREAGENHSQEWAAAKLEFNQSSLSQYLTGKIPLNIEVAVKFARLVGKKIDDFSPAIAGEIAEAYTFVRAAKTSIEFMDAKARTADELRMLTAFRLGGDLGETGFNVLADDILAKVERIAANKAGNDAVAPLSDKPSAEGDPHGLLVRRHSRKD